MCVYIYVVLPLFFSVSCLISSRHDTFFFFVFSVIAFSTKSSGEQGMRLPDEMLMATLNTPTPCDKSVTMAGFLFNSAGGLSPPLHHATPGVGRTPPNLTKKHSIKTQTHTHRTR